MAFKRVQKCKILLKLEILFLSIDLFDQMYLGNLLRPPSLILSPGISEPKLDSPRQDHRLTGVYFVSIYLGFTV